MRYETRNVMKPHAKYGRPLILAAKLPFDLCTICFGLILVIASTMPVFLLIQTLDVGDNLPPLLIG